MSIGRCLLAGLFLSPGSAWAATATGSFNVRMTIQAECKVQSTNDLDFGNRGVLDANIDVTTTLSVQCTNGTPYNVGIGAGDGTGATVSARKMTGPSSATVTYGLYRDSARSQAWGTTVATDTMGGTGNGSAQSITVYGRVPVQTTPAPNTYTDTVTVTVIY